jgi:hypothetical protein
MTQTKNDASFLAHDLIIHLHTVRANFPDLTDDQKLSVALKFLEIDRANTHFGQLAGRLGLKAAEIVKRAGIQQKHLEEYDGY